MAATVAPLLDQIFGDDKVKHKLDLFSQQEKGRLQIFKKGKQMPVVGNPKPSTVSLYLNSLPGQLQTERGWTGSSGQIELRAEVINEYVIWKAPEPIQTQIRQFVEDAHNARLASKRLLEQAIRKVEAMIEGEAARG